ncbi:MAG TPA: NADH-quinone oxidoreductase subunit J [Bryobacteraceae bacterium]|nr:NADH-quinone oxidoreductase subunit J [Bryobacteraceae bacterium]
MSITFDIAGIVAVAATVVSLTRLNAVHALLYLIVSLLAVAVAFFTLGAPFAAALEAIIYAGAIMVLFVFVVMLLNLGDEATRIESRLLKPSMWIGPGILAAILIAELVYLVMAGTEPQFGAHVVSPQQVSMALFGPYLLGVELASFLLLAGLVSAWHLGWRKPSRREVG